MSIGLLCTVAFAGWRFVDGRGTEAVLLKLGTAAPLFSIPLHIILSATPFPSELVGVANGAVYGIGAGTFYSWLGWWLGSLVEFGMVQRSARAFEPQASNDRLPAWIRRFPADHPVFLILGRQLPFGFHVVNVSAGIARVPLSRFAACSAVANVPYAVLTTLAGVELTG